MKTLKEKIIDVIGEYGSLHEYDCDVNKEYGDGDGCDCIIKNLTNEVVETVVEFLSYDMQFKDEEQRKTAVKMYINEFKI